MFPKILNFICFFFFTDYKLKGEKPNGALRKHVYNWNIMQMFFLEFSIPSQHRRRRKQHLKEDNVALLAKVLYVRKKEVRPQDIASMVPGLPKCKPKFLNIQV